MAGNVWQHRIRVCGTLRHNRGILKHLKEAKELKTPFGRTVWKDKRLV
jgi:hypothetical protein